MADDLTRCPFCGELNNMAVNGSPTEGYQVQCNTCDSLGPDADTYERALYVWKVRHPETVYVVEGYFNSPEFHEEFTIMAFRTEAAAYAFRGTIDEIRGILSEGAWSLTSNDGEHAELMTDQMIHHWNMLQTMREWGADLDQYPQGTKVQECPMHSTFDRRGNVIFDPPGTGGNPAETLPDVEPEVQPRDSTMRRGRTIDLE